MTNFFVWTKEEVEEYYPDYAEDHTLADIDAGLRAVKEGTGVTPLMLNKDGISCIVGNMYDNFGTGLPAIGVSYFDGSNKIVPVFEQEDILSSCVCCTPGTMTASSTPTPTPSTASRATALWA